MLIKIVLRFAKVLESVARVKLDIGLPAIPFLKLQMILNRGRKKSILAVFDNYY